MKNRNNVYNKEPDDKFLQSVLSFNIKTSSYTEVLVILINEKTSKELKFIKNTNKASNSESHDDVTVTRTFRKKIVLLCLSSNKSSSSY